MFHFILNGTFEFVRYIPAMFAILFGFPAALSFMPQELRKELLSFDTIGKRLLLASLGVFIGSFVVPDYTTMIILLALSMAVLVMGVLIALKDSVTDRLFSKNLGLAYFGAFMLSTLVGAFEGLKNGLNPDLLVWYGIWLILPTFFASSALVFVLLAVAPGTFKQKILPLNRHGLLLSSYALFPVSLTLLVGTNPSLVVALTTLSGILYSLGILISLDASWTTKLLSRGTAVLALGVALLFLVISRVNF